MNCCTELFCNVVDVSKNFLKFYIYLHSQGRDRAVFYQIRPVQIDDVSLYVQIYALLSELFMVQVHVDTNYVYNIVVFLSCYRGRIGLFRISDKQ